MRRLALGLSLRRFILNWILLVIVEIVVGAFKGEKARITAVAESKEEVSMELYEADIPMTLSMRGDHVRVIERVE